MIKKIIHLVPNTKRIPEEIIERIYDPINNNMSAGAAEVRECNLTPCKR